MDQDESVLEDGEIADDDPDDYNILARPSNYSSTQPNPRVAVFIPQSESEEDIQSSDTDSDSDTKLKKKPKKPRIKLKSGPRMHNPRRRKFDIWSNRAQDEALAETLNSCDVTSKDRSRNVETYDYSLGYKYYNKSSNLHKPFEDRSHRNGNKRTVSDRNNVNYKRRRRSTSADKGKGEKRQLDTLNVDETFSEEDIAKEIGNKLFEEREDLILKVIKIMGKQKAIDVYNETRNIEAKGGMLIVNRSRRRTPGGVFFYLVRIDDHITLDQRNEIFGKDRQRAKQELKEKQKEKSAQVKREIAVARAKLFPDLLTRPELFSNQNSDRKIEDADERNFVNPPPTPEPDVHENSNDGMDSAPPPIINSSSVTLENARDKLCTYDEDYLDLGSSAEMDLF